MGFFSKSKPNIEWRHIEALGQLDEIIEASNRTPQLLYKHSTRCGVSSMVRKQLDGVWAHEGKIIPWHLDLITFRNISNKIAERFTIQHQSPQIIVLVNKEVALHISHASLSSKDLDTLTA